MPNLQTWESLLSLVVDATPNSSKHVPGGTRYIVARPHPDSDTACGCSLEVVGEEYSIYGFYIDSTRENCYLRWELWEQSDICIYVRYFCPGYISE